MVNELFIELPATKRSMSLRRPIAGVGINDAKYITTPRIRGKQIVCPYYRVWAHMIARCYSKTIHDKYPTYRDCSVCDDWLIFSNFKAWMMEQDWQGKALDKDILKRGNRIYSSENCIFVVAELNGLIIQPPRKNSALPEGVSIHKRTGKYMAYCTFNGKPIYRSLTSDITEAVSWYRETKKTEIERIANLQSDIKIREALHAHARFYA